MGGGSERVEAVLAHFGVKGMKWGVRRKSTQGPGSEDHERVTATKARAKEGGGTRALSNKELQDVITRMNLEGQYRALTPNARQKAQKFITDQLLQIGKQEGTRLAKDFATKQISDALKK